MGARSVRSGFISLLIVASLGWSILAARGEQQTGLRLFDLTTAHGVFDKKAVEPTTVFAPDDNPIYVWFRGEGCTTGTTITSVWYFLGADPPLRLVEGSVTVERPDEWGQFNFELAAGRRWAVGDYRIELRVGGALAAETRFRVSDPVTPRTPRS